MPPPASASAPAPAPAPAADRRPLIASAPDRGPDPDPDPDPHPAAVPADLRLFDGLAPFFAGRPADGEADPDAATNWSKAPFAELERDGTLDPARVEAIVAAWEGYVGAMAGLGFTAVAVDDLAHLAAHPWYPAPLRRLLADYAALYGRLFAVAKGHGLRVFATSDYCFFNPAIEAHLDATGTTPETFFAASVERAFARWPQLDGLLLRLGESDGVDVGGAGGCAFASRLTATRPAEARALLTRLLLGFAATGKTLIVRTWTLGAYPIGDLIWNPATYDAVFAGLESPALVVSLKYGPADFFRYLELNPLFFHGPQPKLVELQCRREYEGMGEYPAFVGWLYAGYLRQLREGGANLAGFSALQAGGWADWRRLAFCGEGAVWNELNAETTVRLWAGQTPDEAVRAFCAGRGIADPDRFTALLRLTDRAIERGLYIREFAEKPVWFRRVRVPPLLWVFWRDVTAGGLLALLHRHVVGDTAGAVAEGWQAVACLEEAIGLAVELGLPTEDLEFQLDSFRLLALQREILLGLDTAATHRRLGELLPAYRDRYPHGYRFAAGPVPLARSARPVPVLFTLFLRHGAAYRRADRLLLNRHVSRAKAALARRLAGTGGMPAFVGKQGMSAETLLR
jgi:hypothetical protein